jgi:hypothetical protein
MNGFDISPRSTASQNKRFSMAIRTDSNTYRAYKFINTPNRSVSAYERVETEYNKNNAVKVPFGLTEKRFRWQTRNLGESSDLVGSLSRKTDYLDTSGQNWNSFMNRNCFTPEAKKNPMVNK